MSFVAENNSPRKPRTIPLAPFLAVLCVAVIFILPLFLVHTLTASQGDDASQGAVAATVALGAIFRSNSRSILKSTFMSAIRTALRAITRRIVRTILPVLLRLFLPVVGADEMSPKATSSLLGLVLGGVTLSLSFAGVILLSEPTARQALLFGYPLFLCAFLASSTLVFHYVLMSFLCAKNEVSLRVNTSFDGILLQAYFTGAGSYLPLASDMEIQGTTRAKGICAAVSMLGLLVFSLVLDTIGAFFDIALLNMWAAHLLLYVFVISFPLQPLDGKDIWKENRIWWGAIFAVVTFCFLMNIPEGFYGIL